MAGRVSIAARGVSLLAGFALPFSVIADGPPDNLVVACAGQTISVHALDVPIRSVLADLSRHCGLTVILREVLEETVSVDLQGVSPQLAAKRILQGRSFVLSYFQPPQQGGNRLWVLADSSVRSGSEDIIRPPTGVDETEIIYLQAEALDAGLTDRLRDALADTDRDMREAAAETLGELGGDESAHALAVLLSDPDADVRESAADALGRIGGEAAIGYLTQLLADSDPAIREAADDNLAELLGAL